MEIKNKSITKQDEYNKTPNRCTNCGKTLEYKNRRNKFCNHSCSASYNNLKRYSNINYTSPLRKIKECPVCHKNFYSKKSKYCSKECLKEKRNQEYCKRVSKDGKIICMRCKKELSPDMFYKKNKNSDKVNSFCKNCSNAASTYYKRLRKEKAIEYKGGKCFKCGYHKCIDALDFHHLDRNKKDFNIGGYHVSFEKMKNELDKCVLLCANCHREEHEKIASLKK